MPEKLDRNHRAGESGTDDGRLLCRFAPHRGKSWRMNIALPL
jgi:hypothetical protein